MLTKVEKLQMSFTLRGGRGKQERKERRRMVREREEEEREKKLMEDAKC